MKLLIDIGNTRLKAALWDGATLRPLGAAVHAGDTTGAEVAAVAELSAWLEAAPGIDGAVVASVGGTRVERPLADAVLARCGRPPTIVTSPAEACGVRNAYAEPARLGVDRFLGLVALHAHERRDCVLAGCGTALTLDALAADGTHLGGLIAPSPALMLDALTGATARLARPRGARIVEIADNTADAMQSGAHLAAVALVERFVARAAARFGAVPALVLTGGGATALDPLLATPHRVEDDLVLRGLAVYADAFAGAVAAVR